MRRVTLTEEQLVDLVLGYRDTGIQPVGTEEGARAFVADVLDQWSLMGLVRHDGEELGPLTGDPTRSAVNESRLIEAAAAARLLLSKLSSRLEIDEALRAEVSSSEESLWTALFPGSQPARARSSASDPPPGATGQLKMVASDDRWVASVSWDDRYSVQLLVSGEHVQYVRAGVVIGGPLWTFRVVNRQEPQSACVFDIVVV